MKAITAFLVLIGLLFQRTKGQDFGINLSAAGTGLNVNNGMERNFPNFPRLGINNPMGRFGNSPGNQNIPTGNRMNNFMGGFGRVPRNENFPLANAPNSNPISGTGAVISNMGGFNGMPVNQNFQPESGPNNNPFNRMGGQRNIMQSFVGMPRNQNNFAVNGGERNLEAMPRNQNFPLPSGPNYNPSGGMGGVRSNLAGFNNMPANQNIPVAGAPNNNPIAGNERIRNVLAGLNGMPGNLNIPPVNGPNIEGPSNNKEAGIPGTSFGVVNDDLPRENINEGICGIPEEPKKDLGVTPLPNILNMPQTFNPDDRQNLKQIDIISFPEGKEQIIRNLQPNLKTPDFTGLQGTNDGQMMRNVQPNNVPGFSNLQRWNNGQEIRNNMPNVWLGRGMNGQPIPGQLMPGAEGMDGRGVPGQRVIKPGEMSGPTIPGGPNQMTVQGFLNRQNPMSGQENPGQAFQGLNNEQMTKSSLSDKDSASTESGKVTDILDNTAVTDSSDSGDSATVSNSPTEDKNGKSEDKKDGSTSNGGWFSKLMKGIRKASAGANGSNERSTTPATPLTTLSPFEMLMREVQL